MIGRPSRGCLIFPSPRRSGARSPVRVAKGGGLPSCDGAANFPGGVIPVAGAFIPMPAIQAASLE